MLKPGRAANMGDGWETRRRREPGAAAIGGAPVSAIIARMLLDRTDPTIELTPDPDLQRPSDLPVLRGDNSAIAAATGWAPEIPLSTTLDDVVAAAQAALTTAP